MIITRTPFRITLGGGGTDLPSYYSKYGGFIFAAGLDKYMFIDVNRPKADDLVRIKYTKSETVEKASEVQHELAREALYMMGIEKNVEISSLADVPAGTGLGSSSCYTVGLLNALHSLKREYVSLTTLAEEDFKLEAEILRRPIGKQDPYMAAFGGLTVLEIEKDGRVKVRKANVSEDTIEGLNKNLLMFYTGVNRSADKTILTEQTSAIKEEKKEVVESMHYIKEIGQEIFEAVEDGDITEVGRLFHAHWQHKKKVAANMTSDRFDKIYDLAMASGALGGKISGAGGGGFFVFYTENGHNKLRKAMQDVGLREMRYHFDFEGSKVMLNS